MGQIDPSAIFVFGSSAWGTARRFLKPRPVDPPVRDESSIIKTHGELHHAESYADAFVVPLSHMSGQVWWRFPPEEYIHRLDAALERLNDVVGDGYRVPEAFSESGKDSPAKQETVGRQPSG